MDQALWHNLLTFAQHNWLLLGCFIFLVLLLLVEEGKSRGTGGGQVNPKGAIDLMNNHEAFVIDIRSKEAYRAGHIVGSVSMPKEQFDFNSPKLANNKHKAMIVVCNRGHQANRLGLTLRRHGFDVKVLAGGIEAWKNADLPLKTKKK